MFTMLLAVFYGLLFPLFWGKFMTVNQRVVGSSPTGGAATTKGFID